MATLAWAGMTHIGKVRATNEDQFLAAPPVFLVADGMGGHECGDVASALVTDAFLPLAGRHEIEIDAVERAVLDANASVRRAAAHSATEHAMGTTLVALLLVAGTVPDRWVAVNVGDSRLYRLSAGVLEQITTDHSLVEELVSTGSITRAEARRHPDRNVVTRAMGISDGVVADYAFLELREGDRFLLCSDGVHGELADEQIRVLLGRSGTPDEVAKVVCDAVLRGEARDNLTAVVVDVLGADTAPVGAEQVDEDTSPLDAVPEHEMEKEHSEAVGEHDPVSVDDDPLPPVAIMAVPDAMRSDSRTESGDATGLTPGARGVIEVPEW